MLTGVGLVSRWLSLTRWADFNSGSEFWGDEAECLFCDDRYAIFGLSEAMK